LVAHASVARSLPVHVQYEIASPPETRAMSNTAPNRSPAAFRVALAIGLCATLGAGAVFAMRRGAQPAGGAGQPLAEALMGVRGEMCSGKSLKGTGVRMDVFASADLNSKPIQTGLVPVLDLNVTPSAPVTAGQTVRWSGWMKGAESGRYRFSLPPGVAGTLTLSKAVVVGLQATGADTIGSDLVEARFYPFTLVVTVDKVAADAGTWLLSWARQSDAPQPITRGYLFPPTDVAAAPVKVASVKVASVHIASK
jgi:hypothetical protein